jgi:hypothetical protein
MKSGDYIYFLIYFIDEMNEICDLNLESLQNLISDSNYKENDIDISYLITEFSNYSIEI